MGVVIVALRVVLAQRVHHMGPHLVTMQMGKPAAEHKKALSTEGTMHITHQTGRYQFDGHENFLMKDNGIAGRTHEKRRCPGTGHSCEPEGARLRML